MSKKRRKKGNIAGSTAPQSQVSATETSITSFQEFQLTSTSANMKPVPLSNRKNATKSVDKTHDVCAAFRKAQILRRSISPTGSGFDDSWEFVGGDPIRVADDDDGNETVVGSFNNSGNKRNNNLIKKLFSSKKQKNALKMRVTNTSVSSDTPSGYSSSFPSSPESLSSSPCPSFDDPTQTETLLKDKFINQLLIKKPNNQNSKILNSNEIHQHKTFYYLKVGSTVFVQYAAQISSICKDNLVDLIDFCEEKWKIANFVVFFQQNRDDFKTINKNLAFMGFTKLAAVKRNKFVLPLDDTNFYMEYCTEEDFSDEDFKDEKQKAEDLIDLE